MLDFGVINIESSIRKNGVMSRVLNPICMLVYTRFTTQTIPVGPFAQLGISQTRQIERAC